MLDEPFSAMDNHLRGGVLAVIADYNSRSHATVILVSHDNTHVEKLCERTLSLSRSDPA